VKRPLTIFIILLIVGEILTASNPGEPGSRIFVPANSLAKAVSQRDERSPA